MLSFPMLMPKRITSNANLPDSYDSVVSILKKWPENLSKSSIWNKSACEEALATRPTNLEIKNRRSENLVPGAKLTPLPTDPKIPILLIRRNTTLNSNQRECSEAMCGWSLIAPKGWGMPLWNLFVYAGARVGGLRERTNAFYEAGCPAFPNDYPESPLCTQESIAEASILKAKYNRTPSSKRVNYTKIGTKYPFRPPFHLLVNGDKEKPINVIHSVKIISVLVNMLQSINSDTTFDLFIAEFVALLKQLLKSRPYMSKLTNFDVKSVSLLCVRVQLMYLEGGRGESNSTIYIPDNNELTLKKTNTLVRLDA
ncbi:Ribonucleases P/MRP protein subunit pop1 [Globomyces sp. JEL0801]|nr:Ribonucleases P/MRP protein subunit pop1 [Globomyces sp. JEL0801]